uniref:Cytohesin-1 n=1 Tax=Panagrellus redivivus TaxID=6233 RepID=A0A7E4VRF4_PANRE
MKAGLLQEISQLQGALNRINDELAAINVTADPEKREKLFSVGKKKFNTHPKAGIKYLIDNKLIGEDVDSVAEFLYGCKELKKSAIGEYLGERDDFNIAVMESFIGRQSFRGQSLIPSLRQFLHSFRLPGEAQKIDRLMECFAKHYCEQNPSMFNKPDTCYILCYSIIMLNTSLHNTSVKEKVTLEQFISMHKDIEGFTSAHDEMLTGLYETIRIEPFKTPDDDNNDLGSAYYNPDKAGWLFKLGSSYRSWKRRWFVLSERCLYYFESENDKSPKGIIPLEGVCVRMVDDKSRPHTFEIFSNTADVIKSCKTEPRGKLVEGKHTVYRLASASYEEMNDWTKAIERNVHKNPLLATLQQRKRKYDPISGTPVRK